MNQRLNTLFSVAVIGFALPLHSKDRPPLRKHSMPLLLSLRWHNHNEFSSVNKIVNNNLTLKEELKKSEENNQLQNNTKTILPSNNSHVTWIL